MRGQSLLPAATAVVAIAGALLWSRAKDHESATIAARSSALRRAATSFAAGAASASASSLVLRRPPTTSPVIALHNLDAEIAEREKHLHAGTPSPPGELIGRYLVRAKFVGLVSDLVAADDRSAADVAAHPGDAKAHLARASALGSIHRFADALGELDRAQDHGAPKEEVVRARAGLLLATGRIDDAASLEPAPAHAQGAPIEDLVLRGGIDAQRGEPAESERLFELARDHYRDVSPFTVAWMDFERSRALEVAGEGAKARVYLAEAVAVVPSYTHAVVHLASTEPPERAMALLDGLSRSDDPDVLAARADALRRGGRDDESRAEAAKAKARFEEVLARLPLAFADHAASFYLGVGRDPARALVLAKANARNRPTAEALELWLSAAQAADARDEACAASRTIVALPHAPAGFRQRAEVATRGCP
ncbi:MAG TPA: hypothetical protein VIY73_14265 [Polyangiaceae bacterium]